MAASPVPRQSIPKSNHFLSEEIPPLVPPKPSVAQLESVFSYPVTNCLGEEAGPHLAAVSFQEVIEELLAVLYSCFVKS